MAKNILIGTKVSEEVRNKLTSIADGFGMSLYELIQALLCSLLHYFDSDNIISSEHNTLLNTLYDANLCSTDTFSPISLKQNMKVSAKEAIVFLSKETNEKHNYSRPQAILIKRKDNGFTETYNYDDILKFLFKSIDPDILKALERLKNESEEFSILHVLHSIVISSLKPNSDTITEEIQELFSDIRVVNGEKINDDTFYKKRHNTNSTTTETITTRIRADI